MSEPVLAASGLTKAYGAPVLEDVTLALRPGEVHAVVGENGAGKSTLARICAGIVRPDRGSMTLRGQPYAPRSRGEAKTLGIAIVHQELAVIPTLTVAETIFLGRLPALLGVVDRARLNRDARAVLERVGLTRLDPDRKVGALPLGYVQLVEIASALASRCDVLLLDEPTAALAPHEADALFAQMARLRAGGTAVVLITHRLDEVARTADVVSVLRDGRLVATRPAAELTRDAIVRLMVGRPLTEASERPAPSLGDLALRVDGLSGAGIQDVSFDLRRGEVVGLAGLMGAGRTELLRVIFGASPATSGNVFVGSSTTPARIRSPTDAVRLGLAFLTDDRKRDGLLLPRSVCANVTLGSIERAVGPLGDIRPARERRLVRPLVEALGLRARSLDQPVAQLSGGNQQKVLLARALLRDPSVLLVDEPTRGVDVGARAEVHRLLLALAARGQALVVASSELDELFALSDRILVLSRGRVTAAFRRGEWSPEAVMAAAVSVPGRAGEARTA
ncbi:MAG TPA: sugar ABC transporter ATP-binding protein [Vicinamibacteria bacterium]|nr:sugar ABC transporter ATP-binding protein [Vicinamibacteria bacterium]